MISAKQINILSETEVPFEVGAGFGSDYNIDLNAPSLYVESSHGMDDIKEVFEDDEYIVANAKYGDIYTKNGYTHRFTRNNFVTDNIGNIYTGESESLYNMTTARMPGYMSLTFERDMLALVWNDYRESEIEDPIYYTGDAYCIKSISSVTKPSSYQGYLDITWYMNAKEINNSIYSNYEMCYHYGISTSYDAYAFIPCSHSRIDTGGDGTLNPYNNEADSVICTQLGLISWIRNLFIHIGDTGSSSAKIINYISENMPYGGIISEPRRMFAIRLGQSGWDSWSLRPPRHLSSILNPYYEWENLRRIPPDGNAGKQWIIPFNSEEEYHAACCTKEVATFPYTT